MARVQTVAWNSMSGAGASSDAKVARKRYAIVVLTMTRKNQKRLVVALFVAGSPLLRQQLLLLSQLLQLVLLLQLHLRQKGLDVLELDVPKVLGVAGTVDGSSSSLGGGCEEILSACSVKSAGQTGHTHS